MTLIPFSAWRNICVWLINLLINKFKNKAIFWSCLKHILSPGRWILGARRIWRCPGSWDGGSQQRAGSRGGWVLLLITARSCDFSLHPCSLPWGTEPWHSSGRASCLRKPRTSSLQCSLPFQFTFIFYLCEADEDEHRPTKCCTRRCC